MFPTVYPPRLEPEVRHTPFDIGDTPLFSKPQPTIEEAQALHRPSILYPAAILETPDGFVLALLRDLADWPPHKAAQGIFDATGFRMVACCDPLISVWRPYTDEKSTTP